MDPESGLPVSGPRRVYWVFFFPFLFATRVKRCSRTLMLGPRCSLLLFVLPFPGGSSPQTPRPVYFVPLRQMLEELESRVLDFELPHVRPPPPPPPFLLFISGFLGGDGPPPAHVETHQGLPGTSVPSQERPVVGPPSSSRQCEPASPIPAEEPVPSF